MPNRSLDEFLAADVEGAEPDAEGEGEGADPDEIEVSGDDEPTDAPTADDEADATRERSAASDSMQEPAPESERESASKPERESASKPERESASKPEPAVEPAVSTFAYVPGGVACEDCGTTVERRWRDGDLFVCADCKDW